ncbi:methyltransferase domain-containing protein [Streptomyces sp. 2P-4]|uniref:methyltransferase domain-containing protein n=1 Tax=Streptomyces sp. 2P-4 TaxID=2931974 RepID=UPI00254171D6|nr:methyltransferase domain-containing protein [Streptomyces sp. 2P-4]
MDTRAMSSDWAPTFAAVDRAAFLPDLMWPFDIARQTSVAVDRTEDPERWFAAADANDPIVTQWDDGRHRGREPGKVSTSSSSMPSVVYSLLHDLDVDDGMTVLDVGTGTGETAGALAHRLGSSNVTTIEVDRAVSAHARERLCTLGLYPRVVVGDGFEGHPAGGPYDRILATVGVRSFPGAWVEQVRDGGLLVAQWGTHFTSGDAVACLRVKGGEASGRFTRHVEFMKLRAQRAGARPHAEYMGAGAFADAATSTAEVTEAEFVTGRYTDLPFVLGLRVPDVVQAVADKRDGARPVWFYSRSDLSWACVMFLDGQEDAQVWQSGPRRVWDEVFEAYGWWINEGRPAVEQFGLTVGPQGHRAWLDHPDNHWGV